MLTVETGASLADRLRTHIKADTLDIGDGTWSVARDEFVCEARLAADREMFRKLPHVVGWVGEVAAVGDYVTKDVMGVPVLITRAKDGQLRAFLNGCLHRGAAVAKGCGKARKFICPYHAWTYELDGRLTGVPDRAMFDGIDLASRGLRELPVSDRAGLITIGLSPDVDLDGYLSEVEHLLTGHRFDVRHHYGTRKFDLKTNWKLAVSVNFEGYHFQFLHRESLLPMLTNNSIYDFFGKHALWIFPFRDFDVGETVPDHWPFDFRATVVYFLFPGCVLIEAPGATQMLRVYPGEKPGESTLYMEYASVDPIDTDEARATCEFIFDALCAVLASEDFPQAESCQSGLQAGVPNVVFGRNESILHHLAQRWKEASDGLGG